jgi:hypothetical protein
VVNVKERQRELVAKWEEDDKKVLEEHTSIHHPDSTSGDLRCRGVAALAPTCHVA